MKKIVLISLTTLLLLACGNGKQNKAGLTQQADENLVNVYYFHGKQRCKTCIAVGDVSKETIEKNFASNGKVKFTEINTSEKQYDDLVEKYQVTWNALIIAKGNKSDDITKQAFASAVNNPQTLSNLIIETVNAKLSE